MVTRIYTPPVMPYHMAKPQQSVAEQQQTLSAAIRKEQTNTTSADPIVDEHHKTANGGFNSEQRSAGLSSVQEQKAANRISMQTILGDFQSTLNALGVDEPTQEEVFAYLDVARRQAEKDRPDTGFIRQTLKTAAGTMDHYISTALKQPSQVVRDWVDALLLQPIDFKLQTTPSEAKPEQNSTATTFNPAFIKTGLHNAQQAAQAGQPQEAIVSLNQLLQTPDIDMQPVWQGRVHDALGQAYRQTHRYDLAKTQFEDAIAAFSNEPKASKRLGQSQLHLSDTLGVLQDWPKAQANYQASIETLGQLPVSAAYVDALNGLGESHLQQRQPASAVDAFLSAYQQSQLLPNNDDQPKDASDILSNLAIAYRQSGSMQKAEQAFQLALKQAKLAGNRDSYRATLEQMQAFYQDSQQPEAVLKVQGRLAQLLVS